MESTRNDIRSIAFEQIKDNYHWGKYGEFKVIIDISTGYINATHLCGMAKSKNGQRKEFRKWNENSSTNELVNELSAFLEISRDKLMIVITTGTPVEIRGTYVHPELIPHIAAWASPKFAIVVMRIVNQIMIMREITHRNALESARSESFLEQIRAKNSTRDGLSLMALPKENCIGCVYFISDGQYIKIGQTYNLPKRLSSLQVGSSRVLRVVTSINCMYSENLEKLIHKSVEESRVIGEWFNISEEKAFSLALEFK